MEALKTWAPWIAAVIWTIIQWWHAKDFASKDDIKDLQAQSNEHMKDITRLETELANLKEYTRDTMQMLKGVDDKMDRIKDNVGPKRK